MKDIEKNQERLIKVIYPKTTHMDFNIANALYFATSGEGYLFDQENKLKNVKSQYFK